MESVEGDIVATIGNEPNFISGLNFEFIDIGRDTLGRLDGPLSKGAPVGLHDTRVDSVSLVTGDFDVSADLDCS